MNTGANAVFEAFDIWFEQYQKIWQKEHWSLRDAFKAGVKFASQPPAARGDNPYVREAAQLLTDLHDDLHPTAPPREEPPLLQVDGQTGAVSVVLPTARESAQAERIERLLEACTFALEEIDNRYGVDEPEPGRQVEHPFPGAGAVMQRLRAALEAR